MKIINLKNWEDFDEKLRALRSSTARPGDLLFRGHADASWPLRTTLERRGKFSPCVGTYYRVIHMIKPQIESFTETRWGVPDYEELMKFLESSDFRRRLSSRGELPGHSYMVYLRHHGFPSPLLDWSSSPYVAAYFAFSSPSPKNRAIYAYRETGKAGKTTSSRQPEIYSVGRHTRGHKRQLLQQSKYTLCLKSHQDLGKGENELHFAQHEEVFARGEPDQDVITKFILPSTERVKILKLLDEFNLNAFSLFGSEESLMETMALREFDFTE
jgi:hypothetical protein